MNLSIIIPEHNYDCTSFVRSLSSLLNEGDEILVGDDHSDDPSTIKANMQMMEWDRCTFWQSERNLGRGSMRNRLAEMAKGDWLLICDCDAEIKDKDFLDNYRKYFDDDTVICGGTGNLKTCPSPQHSLRWRYEVDAEKRLTVEHRNSDPYNSFTTFNVAIRRTTFNRIRFNENITEYGHEDTQFAVELRQNGITVKHIDNKLIHTGIGTNEDYVRKTEVALKTLSTMNEHVRNHARVSRTYQTLSHYHLGWIPRYIFLLTKKMLHRHLCSSRPSLYLFNIYKLGYYSTLCH